MLVVAASTVVLVVAAAVVAAAVVAVAVVAAAVVAACVVAAAVVTVEVCPVEFLITPLEISSMSLRPVDDELLHFWKFIVPKLYEYSQLLSKMHFFAFPHVCGP